MEESLLHTLKFRIVSAASILFFVAGTALGAGGSVTYTADAEFDQGTLINVNHDSPNNDQLQLNDSGEAFSSSGSRRVGVERSSRSTPKPAPFSANTGRPRTAGQESIEDHGRR